MPIGTSNGQQYENEFDKAYSEMFGEGHYDPESDTFLIKDKEPEPKEFTILRHGETSLNKDTDKERHEMPVRGWTNTPLDDEGKAQVEKSAEKLSKQPITHIFTSDLPRASQSADIVGAKMGLEPIPHPGLRTWNLGEYTGQTGKEVHDAVDNLCLHKPDEVPPGGESFNQFKDRILATYHEIANNYKDHDILIVSHNSPERVLNSWHENGQPPDGKIDVQSYHDDKGSIEPGQFKKFEIKDPSRLAQSFEDRWPLPKILQESFPSPLDVPHGQDEVEGWWKYLPKQTRQEILEARQRHQMELQGQLNKERGFNAIESDTQLDVDELKKSLKPYPQFQRISMKEPPGGPKMPDVGDSGAGPFRGGGASGKPVKAPDYRYFEKMPYQEKPVEIVPDEPIVDRVPPGPPGSSPRYEKEKDWRIRQGDKLRDYKKEFRERQKNK